MVRAYQTLVRRYLLCLVRTGREILGTQRRIEARIGQLLGEVTQGERTDLTFLHEGKLQINKNARNDFRISAKGFEEYPLDWETWSLFENKEAVRSDLRASRNFSRGIARGFIRRFYAVFWAYVAKA